MKTWWTYLVLKHGVSAEPCESDGSVIDYRKLAGTSVKPVSFVVKWGWWEEDLPCFTKQ